MKMTLGRGSLSRRLVMLFPHSVHCQYDPATAVFAVVILASGQLSLFSTSVSQPCSRARSYTSGYHSPAWLSPSSTTRLEVAAVLVTEPSGPMRQGGDVVTS